MDKPVRGVTLGHGSGSEELVMRATRLRGQFDVACHVTAGGGPAQGVAATVAVTQINLSLSQLTRAVNESMPGIRRKLARYTMRQARCCQTWHRAQCLLIDAIQPFPTFSEAFCFALAGLANRVRAGAG